jgi:hypothetical protein
VSVRLYFEHLYAALVRAQEQRPSRQDMVGDEPGWVVFERNVMRTEVDRIRADHSLPPVTDDAILRAEHLATGHVDYTKKYALYCAEAAAKETT